MKKPQKTVYQERAVLVGVAVGREPDDGGEELASLAVTAGALVVTSAFQRLEVPHVRTFLGKGKVGELAALVQEQKADVVLVDHELSPAQIRNLEGEVKARVVDRTELILDIFATHARTAQAKLQVELAQMEYALPRLRRMWTHLGQQVGGIGQRGPGERQLEVDQRLARDRIVELKRELEALQRRKEREVRARAAETCAVSLVGYTNAGKSTLMNRLTEAGVLVDDKLFSTLDTRTRLWVVREERGSLKVLLSDTVGFIKRLPHGLVSSFHATLEEVSQADLLLHVVDASSPDAEGQIAAVEAVLREIGADQKETILVFNKADRFRDRIETQLWGKSHPEAVAISARTGEGIGELEGRVAGVLSRRFLELEVAVPAGDGRLQAEIHQHCVVLGQAAEADRITLRVRCPHRFYYRLQPYVVP